MPFTVVAAVFRFFKLQRLRLYLYFRRIMIPVMGFWNCLKLDWRLSDETITENCSEEERDQAYRESVRCKVFLGFTSNLISSGVRDTVRYLVQHHMVIILRSIFCIFCIYAVWNLSDIC